jgi:uncharacterized membrane protein YfcA
MRIVGGSLIQTPAVLIILPNLPVATVIGTTKIPAFSGTSFAAYQYLKRSIVWIRCGDYELLSNSFDLLGSNLLLI